MSPFEAFGCQTGLAVGSATVVFPNTASVLLTWQALTHPVQMHVDCKRGEMLGSHQGHGQDGPSSHVCDKISGGISARACFMCNRVDRAPCCRDDVR